MTGSDTPAHQVWTLESDGHTHRVSVWGTVYRRFEWAIDDTLVLTRKSADERVELKADGHGVVHVRFSTLGAPRRATLFAGTDAEQAQTALGLGGADFVPEPGSPAAKFERRLIDYPRLYPVVEALGSAGGIVAGVLATALLAWLASRINWPDLPDIPWPDINLPDILWPEIPWPNIDLPNLPDVSLPEWLSWLLDQLKYIVPIVIAYLVGRREVRRRHRRDHPSGDEGQQ